MKLVHRRILIAAAGAAGIMASVATAGCKRNPFEPDKSGIASGNYDELDKSGAEPHGGQTTLTGADYGRLSNGMAVERIVAARCAREMQCNNIGEGKHFPTHESCATELRSKIGGDLQPNECADGIDAAAIDKCIDTVRSESCNDPVDTIARLAACRNGALCVKAK